MPLQPDPQQQFLVEIFQIRFPMRDGDKQIQCAANDEAIHAIASRDGHHPDAVPDLFRLYRDRLEQAASKKYDAGRIEVDGSVLVTKDDI